MIPTGVEAIPILRAVTGNTVSIIDTATNTVEASVPVGNAPAVIAFGPVPTAPTSKDQCKNDGWRNFTSPVFKNQGECMKYVNSL
jgi:YVTN family beta-propeller protein